MFSLCSLFPTTLLMTRYPQISGQNKSETREPEGLIKITMSLSPFLKEWEIQIMKNFWIVYFQNLPIPNVIWVFRSLQKNIPWILLFLGNFDMKITIFGTFPLENYFFQTFHSLKMSVAEIYFYKNHKFYGIHMCYNFNSLI